MFLQWGLKPCLLLVPWCTSASEPYQLHFHKTTYLDDHGVAISQHSPTFFEGSIPPRSCMTFDGFGINIVWSWWAMDLPHSLYIPLYLLPWSYLAPHLLHLFALFPHPQLPNGNVLWRTSAGRPARTRFRFFSQHFALRRRRAVQMCTPYSLNGNID